MLLWLVAGVAVIAVVAVVLVAVLSGGSGKGPGGSTGPVAGGAPQDHGRRPVTQVEKSTGRTLTVSQDGSGQYKSIQEAADATQPGDTVVISAGTYDEPLTVPHDGAQGAYITYQAAPGADVVISGDPDDDGLVYLKQRNWIKFIGLRIDGSSRHGFYSNASNHVVLQDSEVADSQDGGAVFIDGSDIQVIHNSVTGTNAQGPDASNEAVTLSGIDGFEVAYNVVQNCGEEGIDAKYEARNGKIHDNTSDKNNGPNIYVDAANTIDIYNNTVSGAKGDGKAGLSLGIEDVSETRKTYAIHIYNNVITGNAGGGISFFVESEGTYSDIQIVNNTIVGNPGDGFNPRRYDFTGTNLLRNNIFSGNKRDAVAGQTNGFAIDHNLFSADPIGQDVVGGSPEFVNLQGGDLRLAAGSPGTAAGSPDGAPQTDINGVARPAGGIDLGAAQSSG